MELEIAQDFMNTRQVLYYRVLFFSPFFSLFFRARVSLVALTSIDQAGSDSEIHLLCLPCVCSHTRLKISGLCVTPTDLKPAEIYFSAS